MDLQNIFLTVWNMSLTGSVIIVFVLLSRFALRKAPKIFSYALWAVVLFRLLCPVSFSSVFSVLHVMKAPASPVEQNVTVMDYSALDIPLLPIIPEEPETEAVQNLPQQQNPVIPEKPMEIPEAPEPVTPQVVPKLARDPMDYVVFAWLVGLGLMLCYNVYSCIRLFRQIEGAVPLRKDLYLADYIPTAFVLGIIRPRIYLPSALDVSERGYIIAHERCHIKRKDHIFRLLAYLALCMHWFNPLVWLAFSLSGKDMEMSCDEAVIRMYGPRIRAEYAQSLLRLATGHRSFALTPLAFGEGDTKERVINMSKWKKPKTWAVLCALIACVAVLVACAMNPAAEPTTEPTQNPTTAPTLGSDAGNEEEWKQKCIDAIHGFTAADSYWISYESDVSGGGYSIEYLRHGKNLLIQADDGDLLGSSIHIDGRRARFLGDFWVWSGDEPDFEPDEWLSRWTPEHMETDNWTSEGNVITYEVTWPNQYNEYRHHEGTITYTFLPDGTLESIRREYVTKEGEELISAAIDSIHPKEETAEKINAAILAVSEQCIPEEELDQKRQERNSISEIPSNKTTYDTNFELGAGQMGWKFFDNEIKFKYGAISDDGTSAIVTHYVTTNEVESIVAEESYWLEEFVDGKWQYVNQDITAVPIEKQNVETEGYEELSYEIDWSGVYGKLDVGFYRVGRYHTVTLRSGESETRPCYAKFRVIDQNWERLLNKCENALEELLNRDTYHLIYESYLTQQADPEESGYLPWIIVHDIYKSEDDFLEDTRYLDRADHDVWLGRRGTMRRDGQNYGLEWSGREVDTPLRAWNWQSFDNTWDLWTRIFEWYDSSMVDVREIGREISILMELGEYGHGNKYREIRFYFNGDGSINHIDNLYHPTEGITKMRDKILEDTIFVADTSAADIRSLIESQDVSKPMPFTYAMDVEDFPDARKDGFVNIHPARGVFMETVVELADMECTMKGMEPGVRYNMVEIYRDEEAKMWKVVLRYSQNIGGDQAIYINDEGVTQMIVTYTEENDPRE